MMPPLPTSFTNAEGLTQPWLALWVIAWAAAAVMVVVWPFIVRKRCERLNVCAKCKYSREGSIANLCPECGSAWGAKPPTATRLRLRVSIGMALIGLTGWWVLARCVSISDRGAVALIPTWALIEVLDTNPLRVTHIRSGMLEHLSHEIDDRITLQGLSPYEARRWGLRSAAALREHIRSDPDYANTIVEYVDLKPLIEARGKEEAFLGRDLFIRNDWCCVGSDDTPDPYQMDWAEEVLEQVVEELQFVAPLLADRDCEVYPIIHGFVIAAEPDVQEIVRRAIADLGTLESMAMQADGGINPIIGPIQRDPEGTEWVTVLLNADEPARIHTRTHVLTFDSASALVDQTYFWKDDAELLLDNAAGDDWFRGTITPINRKFIVLLNPKDLPVLVQWWKGIVNETAPPIEFETPDGDAAE